MLEKTFASTILKDTARRHDVTLPGGEFDIDGFGARPRLGTILDRIRQGAKAVPVFLRHAATIRIGKYQFDPADSQLLANDASVRLTEKERDILLALLDAGDQGLARQALLDTVWGYASGVETHTLETHIYRLRQKIETDPAHPEILLTENEGYRVNAD